MRTATVVAAFTADFYHRQALRRELAVNFGAILEHPRPRHSITTCPEKSEPPTFGTDGFLFLLACSLTVSNARPNGYSTCDWGIGDYTSTIGGISIEPTLTPRNTRNPMKREGSEADSGFVNYWHLIC